MERRLVSQRKLFNVTSILQARLIAFERTRKEVRQTVFFTPLDPFGDEAEEEFNNNLSRPRKVHFQSKWKLHHDTVYWVNFMTLSTGSTWPGHKKKDCSFGRQGFTPLLFTIQCRPIASKKWYPCKETTLYIREFPTPRPAPKMVLKDAWQLQQQQQQ